LVPLMPFVAGALLIATFAAADRPIGPRRQRRARSLRPKQPQVLVPVRGQRISAKAPSARKKSVPATEPTKEARAVFGAEYGAAEDRSVRRDLLLSVSGLAVAAGASLIAPPFVWLSAPLLVVPVLPHLRDGIRALVHERRLRMSVVDCLMLAGFAAAGQWLALGLGVTMLTLARILLRRVEDRSHRRVVDIFAGHGKTVWLHVDGLDVEVPFETLAKSDLLVVGAGETIAADGIVVAGSGSVDQSVLTGESRPVEKGVGHRVSAATTMLTGRLRVRVERSGDETTAGQIAAILNRTVDYRRQLQWRWLRIVDRMAWPTLASGLLTWPLLGPVPALAMVYTVGSLGYAMRMVAPIQLFSALRQASGASILIKDGRIFERLQEIDTVVFDKTGTLTEDRPQVAAVHSLSSASTDEILSLAASVEQRQSHPIALAILAAASAQGLMPAPAEATAYSFGFGLEARVGEHVIAVGSARFLEISGIALPAESAPVTAACHDVGHSLVWVAADRQVIGAIELQPTIRPEARQIVHRLQRAGLAVSILSGDHEQPTRHLAKLLGVDDYVAEVLPDGKAAAIDALKKRGRRVCFVGDGVNDALALRQADVSVSLRGATTVATDTAQVVLMDQTLDTLPVLFTLARRFQHQMHRSITITGVPLAIGVGSVLVLHVGLVPVVLLYYTGVGLGIAQASRPLLSPHSKGLAGNGAPPV